MIYATLNRTDAGFYFDTQDQHLVQHALMLMHLGNDDFTLSLEAEHCTLYTKVELEHTGSFLHTARLVTPTTNEDGSSIFEVAAPKVFDLQFSADESGNTWVMLGTTSCVAWEVEEVLEGLGETSPGMTHITILNRLLAKALEELGVAWLSVRGSYASGEHYDAFKEAFENGLAYHEM